MADDGFYINIEKETIGNRFYRKVLYTTDQLQLVLMSLEPGQEIGMETHPDTTQFIRIEKGIGRAIIGSHQITLTDGVAVMIPAGKSHNIINTGKKKMKLYTLYSPPEHAPGTKMETK